jgi:phage shock protein A
MAISAEEWVKMNKMMRDNINEVLEDVVHPRLVDMETSLTNKITSEVKDVKKEIKQSELRLSTRVDGVESNLGKSMDNLAKVVTETKTNHEKRIVRLENHIGIFAN